MVLCVGTRVRIHGEKEVKWILGFRRDSGKYIVGTRLNTKDREGFARFDRNPGDCVDLLPSEFDYVFGDKDQWSCDAEVHIKSIKHSESSKSARSEITQDEMD